MFQLYVTILFETFRLRFNNFTFNKVMAGYFKHKWHRTFMLQMTVNIVYNIRRCFVVDFFLRPAERVRIQPHCLAAPNNRRTKNKLGLHEVTAYNSTSQLQWKLQNLTSYPKVLVYSLLYLCRQSTFALSKLILCVGQQC